MLSQRKYGMDDRMSRASVSMWLFLTYVADCDWLSAMSRLCSVYVCCVCAVLFACIGDLLRARVCGSAVACARCACGLESCGCGLWCVEHVARAL